MLDKTLKEEIDWLRYERDWLLMEAAIIEAADAGVLAGCDRNFNWNDLTVH
jgi:hypothetical protein